MQTQRIGSIAILCTYINITIDTMLQFDTNVETLESVIVDLYFPWHLISRSLPDLNVKKPCLIKMDDYKSSGDSIWDFFTAKIPQI